GHAALEKRAEHMVDLPLAPEARRHDGAGKRAVAGGQVEHGALFERAAENVVERLLLLEHGVEKLDRSAPRRQSDLKVAHMRPVPRLFVGCNHGIWPRLSPKGRAAQPKETRSMGRKIAR